MTKPCRCVVCRGALEPAQQLRYLVETDNLDDPVYLSRIRVLPSADGKPLPVCKGCQAKIQAAPPTTTGPKAEPRRSDLLGMLGALSVGLFLGTLFHPRG